MCKERTRLMDFLGLIFDWRRVDNSLTLDLLFLTLETFDLVKTVWGKCRWSFKFARKCQRGLKFAWKESLKFCSKMSVFEISSKCQRGFDIGFNFIIKCHWGFKYVRKCHWGFKYVRKCHWGLKYVWKCQRDFNFVLK